MSTTPVPQLPQTLRGIVFAAKELGFPALAFLAIFWMAVVTIEKLNASIKSTGDSLLKLQITTTEQHKEQVDAIEKLRVQFDNDRVSKFGGGK